MAHYAKISNEEFTVNERARLQEAQSEKSVIISNNINSDEYATLQEAYTNSFTSETLKTLESEMDVLSNEDTFSMTEEEKTAHQNALNNKQAEIDAEKEALVPGQETALANLEAKEQEGTQDLTAEIETLNTNISNSLARVTAVYTGVDEIEMIPGDSSTLEAEINSLEESKKDYPYNPVTENPPAELIEINSQIQEKIKQIQDIPQVEKDNTVYWEGFYGGCKRTSYNTVGGVHQLGGTPFRKNYAGKGMIYDPVRDAFYAQQPYSSWTINEDTCEWEPPISKPEGTWYWKEDTTEWVDYLYINPDNNQPYPSWTWNSETGIWEPPMEKPEGPFWQWDEETLTWIEN